MSVNIGGDPAAGVPDSIPAAGINSPGVISLNSTESPRATPTPQPPANVTKITTNKNLNVKKVIQELKPVDAAVTKSVEEVIQPTSPTKNYLTQFPGMC